MIDKKDYLETINKARRKRNNQDWMRYLAIGLIVLAVVGIVALAIKAFKGRGAGEAGQPAVVQNQEEPGAAQTDENGAIVAETKPEEDLAAEQEKAEKQAVVDSYQNLGLVRVDGYLNIRDANSTDGHVIGKLQDGGACEIVEDTGDGWYKITSGGVEGYISSEFVQTGDEAKTNALEQVKKRAIIKADKLNIRQAADTSSDIVGQVLVNERYEVLGEADGWIQIPSGYISAEYCDVKMALNEARKLELRAMVVNLYDNLGISDVDNYLNIREEPKEDGKIIGKMPSKAAGNIVETLDGWYKIQSGKVTGYVKSDYILTGQAAKDEALQVATLMAVVNTDMLNARTEPSTDAAIWTQLSNQEKYSVLKQIDGWVEIELETDSTAYVSTDFVDVRYDLNEAVKFSPLEEKSANSSSLRTQICNYALQFLGNPYVWGGTSLTKGADCSGFVLSVLGHFGISLPHYSGSQAKMGKAVKQSEMRPGDLVFYSNSRGTINHVGMYIGNGQIVNAASRKSGIKISTWNYRTPKAIRNVIGD